MKALDSYRYLASTLLPARRTQPAGPHNLQPGFQTQRSRRPGIVFHLELHPRAVPVRLEREGSS